MISYVMIGSNDLPRSKRFFAPFWEVVGFELAYEIETQLCWAPKAGGCKVIVTQPYDGAPALSGNGAMISLELGRQAQVDRAYAVALAAGAQDEGAPGLRGRRFYGAYFRDPDGNKFAVHTLIAG